MINGFVHVKVFPALTTAAGDFDGACDGQKVSKVIHVDPQSRGDVAGQFGPQSGASAIGTQPPFEQILLR